MEEELLLFSFNKSNSSASSIDEEFVSAPIATIIIICYFIMFCTGVVGNLLVCVVIWRQPEMHTPTNCFLLSLAIADIIILSFGMSSELYVNYWGGNNPWILGDAVCKLNFFIPEVATNASVLTILAFSVERYLAICHPLHPRSMSCNLRRTARIIAAIWTISLICALPFAYDGEVVYFPLEIDESENNDAAVCMSGELLLRNYHLSDISSVVFFLLPFTAMVILYSRIALTIKNRNIIGESRNEDASTTPIIRMLAAVVFSFFLCWAPFHIQRVFSMYMDRYGEYEEINKWAFIVSGFSFYISSTINPILYSLMSAKYRSAFKATLCGGQMAKQNSIRVVPSASRTSEMISL